LVEIFGDLNFGIDRAEAARNLARAELLALNAHLETKAQERMRELRLKNKRRSETAAPCCSGSQSPVWQPEQTRILSS
jgi:hypothetical protein